MKIQDYVLDKLFQGIFFVIEACQPDFIKRKQEKNNKLIDYESIDIERENYQYTDFLLECEKINIDVDIARAVWHLSRSLMRSYEYPDYKPFLMDDLCEQFQVDYDDINSGILEPAFIGFGYCLKDNLKDYYKSSKYPAHSIIALLKELEYYSKD